ISVERSDKRLVTTYLFRFSRAENGRADANDGCALFDRGFKIVAHSHRKFADAAAESSLLLKAVANAAEPGEKRPRLFRIFVERRQAHQSRKMQMLTAFQSFDYKLQFGFFRTRFRCFAADVQLDKNRQNSAAFFGTN